MGHTAKIVPRCSGEVDETNVEEVGARLNGGW